MTKNPAISVVITAAGLSRRMGGDIKKEFLALPEGKTILARTVEPFIVLEDLAYLVITLPEENYDLFVPEAEKALLTSGEVFRVLNAPHGFTLAFVKGGETRQKSVCNALEYLSDKISDSLVLVHDGVRPFIHHRVIQEVINTVKEQGAAAPVIPPVDTLKQIDDASGSTIAVHFTRSKLKAVQTPQGFRFLPLLEAHRKAAKDGHDYTDDTEIWSRYVQTPVAAVEGSVDNIKITYPKDVPQRIVPEDTSHVRTGMGYDRHRLVPNRRLLLGGVELPFPKGEDGHSDGDALFHTIADALLGAASLGDIGSYFPPEDHVWKDADSGNLLRHVWKDIRAAGWALLNLDCIVLLEEPKLLPFRDKIRRSIADILGVDMDTVFVKGKTGEKTGGVGRGELVETWAVCLLQRSGGFGR
jgi:2-C-methyl-D-erythritol 4-phosphate cytidylyltransferase/2-C-methyl-D-erythritol 2,4-cyclodiphosphate synthase